MDSNQHEQTASDNLVPLDGTERVVVFRDKGRVYRHILRRITADDWKRYFSKLRFETERVGKDDQAQRFDGATPALELYGAAAVRAEGYLVRGGAALETLPQWKERIPGAHRLAAVELLTDVRESESLGGELEPEFDVVLLDAKWGADGDQMLQYRELAHHFQPPTVEHWKRFNSMATEAVAIGGSRSGRTLYRSRNQILVGLYDELIRAVDGYSVAGQALADPDTIKREMDAFHKVAAVGVLFNTSLDSAAPAREAA